MADALEDLVNIGPALASDLRSIGVHDVDALRALGPIEAGRRLEAAGRHDCINAVLAIEGALQGVRWMSLPRAERERVSAEWARR